MSQENVEIVASRRRGPEPRATSVHGRPFITPLASSHLTSWPPRAASHIGGTKGARAFWEDIHDAFDDWRPQVEELRDCGAAVLVGIRFQGIGKDSGVPIDRRVWQVFKVLDRQAIWWRIYQSEAEALEAVGLSE